MSREPEPIGFPDWFNFLPDAFTGFSSAPTDNAKVKVIGDVVIMQWSGYGTSNASSFTMTAPLANPLATGIDFPIIIYDNSNWLDAMGVMQLGASNTTLTLGKNISSIAGAAYGGFTNSNDKGAKFTITYQF